MMRSGYFVILGLAGTFVLGACSSSSPDKSSTKGNSTGQTNAANTVAAINSDNSNTVVVSNGMVVTPEGADANTVSTSSSDALQPPDMPGRLGDKRNKLNSSAGNVDAAALAMKNARPAPDNSTFTSYLTDAGYEIRTFNNHPLLLKVVKRTANDGSQTIIVFLRNGKIVELPGATIPLIASAPAEVIAGAAGIQPASPKQPATASTGAKKSSN
jgi:hypothetical protein